MRLIRKHANFNGKTMRRKQMLILILTVISGFLVFDTKAQTKKPTPKTVTKVKEAAKKETKKETKKVEKFNVVKEGNGIEGISVGKSSKEDVEKKFGKEYRWEINKKYSFQMTYYKRGLSFYICQSDAGKKVFAIEIKSPYRAKTSKGIILRESTVEDIERIYGKAKSGLEHKGVNFYYNRIGNQKIVTEIDVVENSGIRQCKVNK